MVSPCRISLDRYLQDKKLKNKIMKLLLAPILFCLPFFAQSQQPIDKETMSMMAEMMYSLNKNILTPDTCVYEEIDYVESDYFSEVGTENDIAECLEVIKSTGTLEFAEDWKKLFLFFKSDISPKFSNEITMKIKTELIESNLKNKNGQVIELAKNNMGNSSVSEIEHKTQIGFETVSMEGITGSATYGIKFITGYDKIELTAKDLGRKFTLNGCQIELLDIIENILILESECNEQIDLKVINFASDTKVIDNYSWAKLTEMKKEDETIQVDGCFGSNTQVVYKSFYNVLSNNPNLTLEQFKELIDEKFFEEKNQEIKIVTIRQVGLFENKFIIFTPIYDKREVTIKY